MTLVIKFPRIGRLDFSLAARFLEFSNVRSLFPARFVCLPSICFSILINSFEIVGAMGKIIIWLFFDGGSSRRWEVEITGEHSSVQWKILNLYSECETAKWRVEVQASHFSDTKFRFAWASSPNSIVQSFCRASWSCAKHNCRRCD